MRRSRKVPMEQKHNQSGGGEVKREELVNMLRENLVLGRLSKPYHTPYPYLFEKQANPCTIAGAIVTLYFSLDEQTCRFRDVAAFWRLLVGSRTRYDRRGG